MVNESDRSVFDSQGFGRGLNHGPPYALLLVDFVNGFVKTDSFGGFNTRIAAINSVRILEFFRANRWPVAHSRIVYAADGSDANVFSEKIPSVLSLTEENTDSQIVDELCPCKGELVICKTAPSAFFGTSLLTFLSQRNVKTLVVAGVTTSGCVRASVVDAMSCGFRPLVLSDCVGDRVESAHVSSLRDMQMKYADLIDSAVFCEQAVQ